jgi:tetratricopeptide (TPR) repeat protein
MRAAHVEMMHAMRRAGGDKQLIGRVRIFIDRVKATGARLNSASDRDAAQNIITYWASYLFTADDRDALSAVPPILDPFDPASAPDLSKARNPYQGLNSFGIDDAAGFFGREEATKTLIETIRDNPLVIVAGPMGSGKTSLVAAGLIPKLNSRMIGEDLNPVFLVMSPGIDPFGALIRSIHGAAAVLPKLDAWISDEKKKIERVPESLVTLLQFIFPRRPVMLIVDQFEQLFTLNADAQTRDQFAKAVRSICPSSQSLNRSVLVINQRFLAQALQLEALKPLAKNPTAQFYPPPPTVAELRRIIESPATAVGLKFDDGIVDDLAKEIAGDAKALPTLQFILIKLWNERDGDRISWEAYRKVGRPREALIRTSDAVFGHLSPDEQNIAKKIFLELVHPTIEGGFVRRRVRRDILMQIDAPGPVAHVLDQYVEAGLIQLTRGKNGEDDRFGVIHELLINNSPRLRDWLQREREQSAKKLQLTATARLWEESGCKSGYLITGDALDEAAAYIDAAPELRHLVIASREAARRRERRNNLIRDAVTVVMAVLLVFAAWQWRIAQQQRSSAEQEAHAAQLSAQTAYKVVSSFLDGVGDQLNRGAISTLVAKKLLDTANRIFATVEQRSELAGARTDLLLKFSDLYSKVGDNKRALASAMAAKVLTKTFVDKEPKNDDWRRRLYESAFRIGDLLEGSDQQTALQELTLAGEIARARAAEAPDNDSKKQDISFIENKIGDIWRKKADWRRAEEHYGAALTIADKLLVAEPDKAKWQKAVGDARMRIGELFKSQNRFNDALNEYEIALKIRKALSEKFPQNAVYQSNLSTTYERFGELYFSENKPDQALRYYQSGLEVRDRLFREHRDDAEFESALAFAYVRLADLSAKQNPQRAAEAYRSALSLREHLAAIPGADIQWVINLADTHEKLAGVLSVDSVVDSVDVAVKEYNSALDIRKSVAAEFPDNQDRQYQLASAFERLGDELKIRGLSSQNSEDDLQNAFEAYKSGLSVIETFIRSHPSSGLDKARSDMQEKMRNLSPSLH